MSRTYRRIARQHLRNAERNRGDMGPTFTYLRSPRHKKALQENEKRNPYRRVKSIPPTDYDDIEINKEAGFYKYVKSALLRGKDMEEIAHKMVTRYKLPYPSAIQQVKDIKKILERRGLLNADSNA